MGKKRHILLAVLVLVALAALAWVLLSLHSPEPVYQGKPLEYWLAGYVRQDYYRTHHHGSLPPTWKEADDAIRQMGTNAIPTLLRKLQKRDSKIKAVIMNLLQKQHFIKISYVPTTEFWNGFHGFNTLGPVASNAVPRLLQIFERDPSAFTQQALPVILGKIGPAAGQAVPALLRETAHTNWMARNNAIFALRQIHPEAKTVLPVLIGCLNDSNFMVRGQAACALGTYGRDAQSAVPAILELWRKEAPSATNAGTLSGEGWAVSGVWTSVMARLPGWSFSDVNRLAAEALKSIDPEAAAKAGVK